jgi:hypothetical protein
MVQTTRYKGEDTSHSARVSAWAHLGRHLGMFQDKATVSGDLTVEIVQFSERQ